METRPGYVTICHLIPILGLCLLWAVFINQDLYLAHL